MKCPSCSFIRNNENIEPKWQCPNCGIAYNKFETDPIDLKAKNLLYLRGKENEDKLKSSYNKILLSISLLLIIIGFSGSQIIVFICMVLISILILIFTRDMLITEHCIGPFSRLVRKEDAPLMYRLEIMCGYGLATWSLFIGIKCDL